MRPLSGAALGGNPGRCYTRGVFPEWLIPQEEAALHACSEGAVIQVELELPQEKAVS